MLAYSGLTVLCDSFRRTAKWFSFPHSSCGGPKVSLSSPSCSSGLHRRLNTADSAWPSGPWWRTLMSPLLSWMSVGVEAGMSIFTSCWMYSCHWGQASDFFQGHPVCFSTGNLHRFGSLNCQWYLHFSVKKPIVLLLVLDSMKGKQLF